jgi:hypothetical protein
MVSISRKIVVQVGLGKNVRPYFKNKTKKVWGHGSGGREPALQVICPEFKVSSERPSTAKTTTH